jgi:xylulokinase
MSSLLGIDLGTSSVKVVAFAVAGVLKGVGMAEYPILTPRLGYAEQDPEEWWRVQDTSFGQFLKELLSHFVRSSILWSAVAPI